MRLIDITGQKFSMLKVLSIAGRDKTNKTMWLCVCECGKEITTTGLNLKSGNTKSCGCLKSVSRFFDISGNRFGKLTAISVSGSKKNVISWLCRCDCGKEKTVTYGHLSSGHTRSCGCLISEVNSILALKNLAGKKRENHPRWNPDLTESQRNRFRSGQSEWSSKIFKRDGYQCVKCFAGGHLHAHHLNGYARHPERATDTTNGVTLCLSCHREFHKVYGTRDFSRADFFTFIGGPDPGDWTPIVFRRKTGQGIVDVGELQQAVLDTGD
jgi:5-methylcytosine-specific restriction endonuclease McrA